MSMISGLIDELNKSADEWNASNMFELARMCREAADTIWKLRDDLQRANADNAKLREQIHWLKKGDILHVLTDQEYIDQCERERLMQVSIDALDKENAKLRELVQKMMRFMEDGDWCTTCEVAKECDAQERDAQEQYEEDCLMRGVFHDHMRELGVDE